MNRTQLPGTAVFIPSLFSPSNNPPRKSISNDKEKACHGPDSGDFINVVSGLDFYNYL
jgi:hypothetical protein